MFPPTKMGFVFKRKGGIGGNVESEQAPTSIAKDERERQRERERERKDRDKPLTTSS